MVVGAVATSERETVKPLKPMKYFTIQWWSGEVEDQNVAFEDYRRYLDQIDADLPESIRRLARDVCLHDARLLRLHVSLPERSLVIELDGSGYDEQSKSYFGRRFRLTYGGVESITSTADPETGLPGPHGYGDLGYDEIERIQPGIYEHRMLFSTGIELHVRLSDFSLWYEDYKTEGEGD
jgi:hypothetical protein